MPFSPFLAKRNAIGHCSGEFLLYINVFSPSPFGTRLALTSSRQKQIAGANNTAGVKRSVRRGPMRRFVREILFSGIGFVVLFCYATSGYPETPQPNWLAVDRFRELP